jgi:hypothetical protein
MKWLVTAVGFALLFVSQMFASDHSGLARVTVYWHGEGSGANAAWNGARLREGHCAVDPKKIPYGSKVVFHDAECMAVDSGPDVVNRKAARVSGRNAMQSSSIVFSIRNRRRLPGQKRTHTSWSWKFAHRIEALVSQCRATSSERQTFYPKLVGRRGSHLICQPCSD